MMVTRVREGHMGRGGDGGGGGENTPADRRWLSYECPGMRAPAMNIPFIFMRVTLTNISNIKKRTYPLLCAEARAFFSLSRARFI